MVLDEVDTCTDETLLYYLMSGLHASVNTHISDAFEDEATHEFSANSTYFMEKIGHHKDRVKNLHFIYAAVVKAVGMMEPILLNREYTTGLDKVADRQSSDLIRELIRKVNGQSTCPDAFQEKAFFQGSDKGE